MTAGNALLDALAAALRLGIRIPLPEQQRILTQAKASQGDLAALIPAGRPACPGDPCPSVGCIGKLVIVNTIRQGGRVTQYMACSVCHARPRQNKRVLPADSVPRRLLRTLRNSTLAPSAEGVTMEESNPEQEPPTCKSC